MTRSRVHRLISVDPEAPTEVLTTPARHSRNTVQRYFETSLLLMLGAGFATLAATGRVDLTSVLAVSVALGVRLWGHFTGADWVLSPGAVTRLAILYILFYPLDLLVLSASPSLLDAMLTATVHLVLFSAVIKAFSACTHRDYGYLAALSFLMMLAGAILTVSAGYLFDLGLYVIFATSTFVSYEMKRSSESAASAGYPAAPTGGYSGGSSASSTGRGEGLETALATTTLGLAAGITVLALLLFFAIPRYRTGYLTSFALQAENITGFSEHVSLGDIGRIKQSNLVVMRVMTEGNPRQLQGAKWRGIGLTSFDGRHWYNDNTALASIPAASSERFILPFAPGWEKRPHRPVRYRVLLAPVSTDVLFAAAVPRELSGRLRLISMDEADSLRSAYAGGPPEYEVVSDLGLPSPADLRRAPPGSPIAIRLVYLQLPDLNPRVGRLARQMTERATNNYDRAMAIQNYLQDNFRYTLDPPAIQPGDPVGSFLFVSKQGYCEYFAAAMALMLRTVGIPSRLVNGFQTGSYNRVAHDFVVRARDAHTWVEVYFPGYGWVPFDPTPADPNAAAGYGVFDDYLDALGLFWNEWIVNYDFTHQIRLAGEVERDSRRLDHGVSRCFARFKEAGTRLALRLEGELVRHKLPALALILAVMAGIFLLEGRVSLQELRFLWTWKLRPRRTALSRSEAALVYRHFLSLLRRQGLEKTAAQTPREFARSIAASPFGAGAVRFTELYYALRFGTAPVSATDLRSALASLREWTSHRRPLAHGR